MTVNIYAHERTDGVRVRGWLSAYDPNAMPVPVIEFAHDRAHALRFASHIEAAECWRAVREPEPIRPWDGKPNRPLTAYSVEILDEDREPMLID